MTDDPFERAVARESRLRAMRSRDDVIGVVIRYYAAIAVAWAVVLAAHWIWLADPRWLVVLHTVVFGVTVIFWLGAALFARRMTPRHPDWVDEAHI